MNNGAKSVIGICNPLLDVTIEAPSEDFYLKYDIKNGNAILAEKPIH